MDYSPEVTDRYGDAGVLDLIGIIMVVTIIILFFVIILFFCLHLYAKLLFRTTTHRRRRRRLIFAAETEVSAERRGLDPSILKTLAVIAFDPKSFKDGLECAVCLCEISEGEKTRILPKCSHGFHVECIDMWFQSHSTCPLCRNPVSNQIQNQSDSSGIESNMNVNVVSNHQSSNAIAEPSSSSLFVGSTSEIAVIDIPRLKSFKRLLSGNRRVNPSSPRDLDLESQS